MRIPKPKTLSKLVKVLPIHSKKALLLSLLGLVVLSAGGFAAIHYMSTNKPHNNSNQSNTATYKASKPYYNIPKYIAGASCQTPQLSLTPIMEVGGDLSGQIGGVFSLTNTSNTVCTINGYPTAQIGSFSSTGQGSIDGLTDPGTAQVTLTPNSSAYFGAGWWFQNFNYGGLTTGCVDGTSIVITPPNNKTTLTTNVKLGTVCPGYKLQGIGNVTAIRLPLAFGIDFTCEKMFFQPFSGTPPLPQCKQVTIQQPQYPTTISMSSSAATASQQSVSSPLIKPGQAWQITYTFTCPEIKEPAAGQSVQMPTNSQDAYFNVVAFKLGDTASNDGVSSDSYYYNPPPVTSNGDIGQWDGQTHTVTQDEPATPNFMRNPTNYPNISDPQDYTIYQVQVSNSCTWSLVSKLL